MLFGKKTKIYAPNISANVEADLDAMAKMKKGGEKGAQALMAALKAKGYKYGGEKPLTKMAKSGMEITPGNKNVKAMISPADKAYGQTTPAPRPAKKQFGGTTGRRTYSGKKK